MGCRQRVIPHIIGGMKSNREACECLWLRGCKPCTSAEGVKNEKIGDQIYKDFYPELGCSGNLSPTETVHLVNVGTSCIGRRTGLAAADVIHGGRENRSSLRAGKPSTWRRTLASRKF